eukprot:4394873-Heterocapsa_arctica.AAC.1
MKPQIGVMGGAPLCGLALWCGVLCVAYMTWAPPKGGVQIAAIVTLISRKTCKGTMCRQRALLPNMASSVVMFRLQRT